MPLFAYFRVADINAHTYPFHSIVKEQIRINRSVSDNHRCERYGSSVNFDFFGSVPILADGKIP